MLRTEREGVLVLVTCTGFLSHFSTELELDSFLANVNVDSQAGVGKGKRWKYRRETEPLIPSKTVNHAE